MSEPLSSVCGTIAGVPSPFDAWNRPRYVKIGASGDSNTVQQFTWLGSRAIATRLVTNSGIENSPADGGNGTTHYYTVWGRLIEERNGSNQTSVQYLWGPGSVRGGGTWPAGGAYASIVWMERSGDTTIGNDTNPDLTDTGEGSETPADKRYFYHLDRNGSVIALSEYGGGNNGRLLERYSRAPHQGTLIQRGDAGSGELGGGIALSIAGNGFGLNTNPCSQNGSGIGVGRGGPGLGTAFLTTSGSDGCNPEPHTGPGGGEGTPNGGPFCGPGEVHVGGACVPVFYPDSQAPPTSGPTTGPATRPTTAPTTNPTRVFPYYPCESSDGKNKDCGESCKQICEVNPDAGGITVCNGHGGTCCCTCPQNGGFPPLPPDAGPGTRYEPGSAEDRLIACVIAHEFSHIRDTPSRACKDDKGNDLPMGSDPPGNSPAEECRAYDAQTECMYTAITGVACDAVCRDKIRAIIKSYYRNCLVQCNDQAKCQKFRRKLLDALGETN